MLICIENNTLLFKYPKISVLKIMLFIKGTFTVWYGHQLSMARVGKYRLFLSGCILSLFLYFAENWQCLYQGGGERALLPLI